MSTTTITTAIACGAVIVSALAARHHRADCYARGYMDGLRSRPPAGPDELTAMRAARRRRGRRQQRAAK